MKKNIEFWCYGGNSKEFFMKKNSFINDYNAKTIARLLIIMTVIIGMYLVASLFNGLFSQYFSIYVLFFSILVVLLFLNRLTQKPSIVQTKMNIFAFSTVMFVFVCILGTIFEPNSRATLFIVYVLVLPMLFVIPINYTYGYLIIVTIIFSCLALEFKDIQIAQMDIAHSVTCLVIGLFISQHILESRVSLYEIYEKLDNRNYQLENLARKIPGGVCKFKNDEKLTLLTMSDEFKSMLNYDEREIEECFNNKFIDMIYANDREKVKVEILRLMQTGLDMENEFRVLCKDRNLIWILAKFRLLPDGDGGECLYGVLIEITDPKRKQEELRLRLEQYQIIMNQTTDILFEWDIREDTLTFSANWSKKFGYDPINREISSQIPLSENIHKDDMAAFMKIMSDTAAGEPYSETEFRIKDIKNKYRWCRIRATAQFDNDGQAIKAVGVILDIHAEKREKQNLLKMAQQDPLTGIFNKITTNKFIEQKMNYFDGTVKQALMIVDVDYFKLVNDTYGHLAGDKILSQVASALKENVRSSDIVGRIGGDEFLVYLAEVESEEVAVIKAKKLHNTLGKLLPEIDAPAISCSIGVAVFPHGDIDFENLYCYADQALYQCKSTGRNGVVLFKENKSFS